MVQCCCVTCIPSWNLGLGDFCPVWKSLPCWITREAILFRTGKPGSGCVGVVCTHGQAVRSHVRYIHEQQKSWKCVAWFFVWVANLETIVLFVSFLELFTVMLVTWPSALQFLTWLWCLVGYSLKNKLLPARFNGEVVYLLSVCFFAWVSLFICAIRMVPLAGKTKQQTMLDLMIGQSVSVNVFFSVFHSPVSFPGLMEPWTRLLHVLLLISLNFVFLSPFRILPPPSHSFLQKGVSHWGKLEYCIISYWMKK